VQITKPNGQTINIGGITNTYRQIQAGDGLQQGKDYTWRVKSCNENGCGEYSTEWGFKVQLSATIDLGSDTDHEYTTGIAHPQPNNGQTEIQTITTKPSCNPHSEQITLRRNIGGTSDDKYFYFRIFDGFVYDGHDGSGENERNFEISVQFWNYQEGAETEMIIEYDAYGQNDVPEVKELGRITLGTAECKKTVTYTVNDARFGNGLVPSSDIRIKASDNSPWAVRYINKLTVTRR
jgi:hypothetical protein